MLTFKEYIAENDITQQRIAALDKEIAEARKKGADQRYINKLVREANKLADKLKK